MYESWAKCSLCHVYLKNIGMCAAQTGLSSQPKYVWSYRPIFLGLSSLNTTSECWLWCCQNLHRGYYWGENKHLCGLMPYHWRPQITQENLDSCIKTYNQYRCWRGDRKILNGKGWLGHLHLLLLRWTLAVWNWQGCSHAVSSWFWVFDVMCFTLLEKQWNFLI